MTSRNNDFLYRKEFNAAIAQMDFEDFWKLVSKLDPEYLSELLIRGGLKYKPERASMKVRAMVVQTEIRRNPREVGGFLFVPLFSQILDVLDEQQFDNPSADELKTAVSHLEKNWKKLTIDAWLIFIASCSEMKANGLAQALVADLVEPSSEEVVSVSETIEIPESIEVQKQDTYKTETEELVYTDLTRALIRMLVKAAGKEEGSPEPKDIQPLIDELLASNSNYPNFWYISGFASGLLLIDRDHGLNSPASNEKVRAWQLGGYLFGLLRREEIHQEEILDTISRRETDFQKIAAEPFAISLYTVLIPFLSKTRTDLIVDILENLLDAKNHSIDDLHRVLNLLSSVDTQSVYLLRKNQNLEANNILRAASETLTPIMRVLEENKENPEYIYVLNLARDLRVRFAIGLGACERLQKNFENAKKSISEVPEELLKVASNRTISRYFLQKALAFSKTAEIVNVRLPRSSAERETYKAKFDPVLSELQQAAVYEPKGLDRIYNSRYDAIYLLAGISLANGDWDQARNQLEEVGTRFEGREERRSLLPEIHLHQIMVNIYDKENVDVASDISRLCEELDDSVKLLSYEVDLVFKELTGRGFASGPQFLNWLGSPDQKRHEVASKEVIEEFGMSYPQFIPQLAQIAKRINQIPSRLEVLTVLLECAFESFDSDAIGSVIGEIESTIQNSPTKAFEIWADFISTNRGYREHFGDLVSDTQAAAYFKKANNQKKHLGSLSKSIENLWPVQNYLDLARINILIDELSSIDAEMANIYREDAQSKAPDTYVPFVKTVEENFKIEPVRILFVGGTREEQGKYQEDVLAKLADTYADTIQVKFEYPGWGNNWPAKLEQIGRDLEDHDILVLMPLIRTNFGWNLRKLVDAHSRSWLPCTGNGVTSIYRAISEAFNVVNSQRSKNYPL